MPEKENPPTPPGQANEQSPNPFNPFAAEEQTELEKLQQRFDIIAENHQLITKGNHALFLSDDKNTQEANNQARNEVLQEPYFAKLINDFESMQEKTKGIICDPQNDIAQKTEAVQALNAEQVKLEKQIKQAMELPPSYEESTKNDAPSSYHKTIQAQPKTTVLPTEVHQAHNARAGATARTIAPQVLISITMNNLSQELNNIGKKMEAEKTMGGKIKGYAEIIHKTLHTMGFIAGQCLNALKNKFVNKISPNKNAEMQQDNQDENKFKMRK